MKLLYGGLTLMVLLFAAAMSFATLSVYNLQWWWALVAGGLLMLMAAIGGIIVPTTMKTLEGGELKTAKVLLQLFGAVCGLLFFTMALITWALGKRYFTSNNTYEVLGLLIFLGFAGVGLQGAVAMSGYFTYVRNKEIVVPARKKAAAARHG